MTEISDAELCALTGRTPSAPGLSRWWFRPDRRRTLARWLIAHPLLLRFRPITRSLVAVCGGRREWDPLTGRTTYLDVRT